MLLELGGKDPMIVCADADLARAAKGAVWGAFQNSGQTCMPVERVYFEALVAQESIDLAIIETGNIRQDAGGGDIGSMTHDPQLEIVEAHLADAIDKGARVLVGGRRLQREGLWFEPTVLTDVDHSMAVMTEETFGPVLPIMAVADSEEAVALANDSVYGLNSSVWSRDDDAAVSIAARLEAGNVCINDCIVSYAITGLRFGGVKQSGIGRLHGSEGLRAFFQTKSIMDARLTPPREPWWFPVPDGLDRLDRLGNASLRVRFGSTLTALRRLRSTDPGP